MGGGVDLGSIYFSPWCFLNWRFIRYFFKMLKYNLLNKQNRLDLLDSNYKSFLQFLTDHPEFKKYCKKDGAFYILDKAQKKCTVVYQVLRKSLVRTFVGRSCCCKSLSLESVLS